MMDGGNIMQYQRCTRCVMDNESDDSITFLNDGTCNYCNDVLNRKDKEYFSGEEGKRYIENLAQKIKEDCKEDRFDCMVGISGGLDSSYVLYLGYKIGLRMLAIHVDDGYDTDIAKNNIKKLCKAANVKLLTVKPDAEQYNDLILSFIKASVPNLCAPQDNILFAALDRYAEKNKIKYMLSGRNFAHECILERGKDNINVCDKKHIVAIHKLYGTKPIDKLPMITLWRRYIFSRYFAKAKSINILNYVNYDFDKVLTDLNDFCGFEYYGGKHYESVLTRFLQCYYLPVKYQEDKRKSHFSSLIVNGQMDRDEAIEKLKTNPYINSGMWKDDLNFIADRCSVEKDILFALIGLPARWHREYPHSVLNELSPLARRFRHYLG